MDTFIPKASEKQKLVVVNEAIQLSEEEVSKKLEEFQRLKIHPRDKEENQLRVAKEEQLYARATGELRDEIGHRLGFFTSSVSAGCI